MANAVLTEAIDALAARRDLTAEESAAVLAEIMGGNASEVQTAAVLVALRTKGETVEELVGLATTMRRFPEAGIPALGVCLGHQSLAQAFGGRVVRHVPVHGKATEIEHDGRTIFDGLPSPLTVGRYHSLVVDPDVPDSLIVTATGGGVIMAVQHRDLPAHGVQFHPESVLTPEGRRLLENFLAEPDAD